MLIDVIVHALTRFTRVFTLPHMHAHSLLTHMLGTLTYLYTYSFSKTITIQITQRAVQNKKQLIGAVAI